MERKDGFTLIELIIVLAVIAALLSAITPVAVNALKKAKATQVALNLRTLQVALLEYYVTETPNTTVTIDDLSQHLYISKKPENYVINWSKVTAGEADAFVIYTGADVNLELVKRSLPSVVFVSTFNSVDGGSTPTSMVVSDDPKSGYYPALKVFLPFL